MAHASSMECHHHRRLLRSPSRRTSSPPQPQADERLLHHHRFLRPGALARLRDSKVIARSLRSAAAAVAVPASPPARMLPPSSPPPSAAAAGVGDGAGGVPHFLGGVRGMRYPLRKKLAAARSVVFLPPPAADAGEIFMDAFAAATPAEMLAAH